MDNGYNYWYLYSPIAHWMFYWNIIVVSSIISQQIEGECVWNNFHRRQGPYFPRWAIPLLLVSWRRKEPSCSSNGVGLTRTVFYGRSNMNVEQTNMSAFPHKHDVVLLKMFVLLHIPEAILGFNDSFIWIMRTTSASSSLWSKTRNPR